MGYRSDVAIAIYGPEEAIVPLIAAERLKPGNVFSTDAEFIKHFKLDPIPPSSDQRTFIGFAAQFDSVKWYHTYPEVHAWHRLLDEAAEVDDVCTEFVRVGEETQDVETAHHGYECRYLLTTYTRIESDIPETTYSEDQHDNSASTVG